MFDSPAAGIRQWIASLFASAIKQTARPEDRQAAIQWLLKSRDVLASDLGTADKLKRLHSLIHTGAAVAAIANAVADAVKNYRASNMPWSMKVAVPTTLAVVPFVGMHGAGIAAFGSAIGLPVLLLVFLGTAGITSVIEAVATNPNSAIGIAQIVRTILSAEASRRMSAAFKDAMADGATAPRATPMPDDEIALRAKLLEMDPYDFECHVMSFFDKAGLFSAVTPRSNDFGLDGYAAHPEGLIIVQCKRNALENKVGRPKLMEFESVVRHQGAWRGYIVTTSTFSRDATAFALFVEKMILVDIHELVRWHNGALSFQSPRAS